MDFKRILTENRRKQGISIRGLAKLTGLPKSTIANYEQGHVPTLDKAEIILRAMKIGVTVGYDDREPKEDA